MFVRAFRRLSCLLLVSLATALPARADRLADFHAAVERTSAQYRTVMATLETRSREETSAEVHRLREHWQFIADRFGGNRPAAFADDQEYSGMFMLIDARIVGALIVIDIGSRDAAREALAPIAETLSRLSARSAPESR